MKSRPSAFRALIFSVLVAMLAPAACVAALSPKNYPTREATVMFEEAKGLLTSPALSADGLTLYVGSADRRLYAIDTFSGAVNWFLRLPAPIFSSPTVDDNDLVYVGCMDGRLYGISDQGDFGQIDFRASLGGHVNGSPAVDDDGNIYVGTTANHLFAFRSDESRLWVYTPSNNVNTPVISPEGTIYVVSGGFVRGVDATDGSEVSSFSPRSAIHSIPAMSEDGTLYFGSNDERVYALGSGGGPEDVLWRFNTRANVFSSPAIGADGSVYVGNDKAQIFCLNTNGVRQWTVPTRGPVRSPLSIGVDGTVYAGCDDKRLYAVSAAGEVLWASKVKSTVRSSPALDAFGGLYFTAGKRLYFIQTEAEADDADEAPWRMFRKDRLHSARATECRPFLIQEPSVLVTNNIGTTNETVELSSTITVDPGQPLSIPVIVRAGAPLTYQWHFNGEEIDPTDNRTATNATLVIASVTAEDAGDYTVQVFNDCGEVESDTFTLNVNSPPIITSQPTNVFTLAGNTITLRVGAAGTLPLTYQWYFVANALPGITNGLSTNILAGRTNATLTLSNITPAQAGGYFVVITNVFGTNVSMIATVQVFTVAVDFAAHPLGAGHRHSLAVLTNHTLWAWGLDNFGQLGDNQSGSSGTNFVLRNVPTLIGSNGPNVTNAVWLSVSGGSRGYNAGTNQPGGFSLGIQTNGSLWAWGLNNHGQLGIDSTNNQRVPLRVGSDTNWIQVEAGATHSIGLKRDGTIWTWGGNEAGQLGIGSTNRMETSPVRVGTDSAWVEVRAGGFFSLARRADGTIWAWGTNRFGELGIGINANSGSNSLRRVPVMVGTNSDWAGISAGGFHALGRRADGTIWSWGRNNFGQLGLATGLGDGRETFGTNQPAQIGSSSNWTSIEAGTFHSFAIDTSGSLSGWGANFYGQIGNGEIGSVNDTNDANRISPVAVASGMTWRFVDASDHSLGMTTDGRIWAWGLNNHGQVGDGTGGDGTRNNNRSMPVELGFNTGTGSTNPPVITSPTGPSTQTVLEGETVTFSVSATGTSPLRYQWYFNSVLLSTASNSTALNPTLEIANARAENVGDYFAVVSNQFGRATSAVFTLIVTNSSGQQLGPTNAPVITQEPLDRFANEGGTVSFSMMATGTPVIRYQWYFFSNAIVSATQTVFTITNVQGTNAGFYRAVAENPFGSVTTRFASLTVTNTNGVVFFPGGTNGTPISNSPPFISQQPTNRAARTNTPASFTVVAGGAAPLFYAWRLNSNIIDSATNATATNATLTITNVGSAGTNFYDVVVTNNFGSVTSTPAMLVVTNSTTTGGCPNPNGCDEVPAVEIRLGTIALSEKAVTISAAGARTGQRIVLEYKDLLSEPEWKPLSTNDSNNLKLVDPTPPIDRSRFYRVRVE